MHFGIRQVSIAGICTLVFAVLVSCKSTPKPTETSGTLKPLNVVVITLDTVRADHLHCYGYDKIKTPNIDALAASGVLFEKAVAQTPLTQPSHASMFTGTNPNVHNVRDTGGFALQPSSVTLATILQKRGWDTAGIISASVLKKLFGFSQGFAFYDDKMEQTKTGQDVATRAANLTVDHALTWLNTQQGSKPFFLWVHLYDAHRPYQAPAGFQKEFAQNQYDAEIAFEDQELGRFLDALKKKSPADKTLVVLLADHGEGLGDHGEYEHGVFLYDATVRIAWIMAGPGVPAGVRVRQQAREIDMLPTILDLMGGRASSAVQGTSLVPAFSGKTVPSNYSYEETLYPQINMGWASLRGIHTADWMYVRAPKPELYDLDKDPGELNNVIDAHPKEYRELEAQLKKMSPLGKDGKETVVVNRMDQSTTQQLQSLGYVAGFSDRNMDVDGKGPDPKDHVATLKLIEDVSSGPDADKMPDAKKVELLRQGLANDANNPTLYLSLIHAYEKIGQYQQSLQIALQAMQHGIRDGMVLSETANLYLRLGDIKNAISYYEKAAQLNPLDVEGQNDLATAYLQNGRVTDAERVYKWVLAIQPYAPSYNGLGIIAVQSKDFAAGRKNFEYAVQLDPNYVEGQLNLGIVCTQMHDIPCARKAFRVFVANAPPSYGKVILQAKSALARMGPS